MPKAVWTADGKTRLKTAFIFAIILYGSKDIRKVNSSASKFC